MILQNELRVGLNVDSFEKEVIDRFNAKKMCEDTMRQFERELFRHCVSYDHTTFSPVCCPLYPMLARAISDTAEVYKFVKEYQSAYVEPKYDGERLMVHWDGRHLSMYGRSGESAVLKYHDLTQRLLALFHGEKPVVLDGEVIAVSTQNGKPMSFNEIQRMPRKNTNHGDKSSVNWNTQMVAFDCLFENTRSLINNPILDRKSRMVDRINRLSSKKLAPNDASPVIAITPKSIRIGKDMHQEIGPMVQSYKDDGLEGAILKPIGNNTPYVPRSRTQWIKLKMFDSSEGQGNGFGDTLDVVVMGGYWGNGNKSHTLSSYLIGVSDPSSGKYAAISKIGTGFSLNDLSEILEKGQSLRSDSMPEAYMQFKGVTADVWFSPGMVFEVNFDSLTESPKYFMKNASQAKPIGVSLRFPRFIKLRTDKSPTDVNTVEQVLEAVSHRKPRQP